MSSLPGPFLRLMKPQKKVELPGSGWRVRFNSDARTYSQLFGDHATPDVQVQDGVGLLDLGPYSCVIYVPA